MKPATEILLMAADVIEHVGHHKGGITDGAGNYCAIGAIELAAESSMSPPRHAAVDALRKYVGTFFIGEWNDHPMRTAADVYTALREAARQYEESTQ